MAQWLRETWQWVVRCDDTETFFLTERAARQFIGHRGARCSRVARADREMDQDTEVSEWNDQP